VPPGDYKRELLNTKQPDIFLLTSMTNNLCLVCTTYFKINGFYILSLSTAISSLDPSSSYENQFYLQHFVNSTSLETYSPNSKMQQTTQTMINIQILLCLTMKF